MIVIFCYAHAIFRAIGFAWGQFCTGMAGSIPFKSKGCCLAVRFFLFSCLFGRGPSAYFWLDVALGDVGLVQYLSGRIGGTLESSRSRCVENQILFLTSGDAFSLIISQSHWLQYMGSHVLLFPALRQSLQSYPIRPYGVYPCFLEVGLEVFIVGTVSCVFPGCDTWVGRSRYPWL